MSAELPPAALALLRPFRDVAFVQDCREKFFERIAICVESHLSESEAEAVALAAIERETNARK